MPRRRRKHGQATLTLTPNQVVAYNLARARLVRGWTQEQAADALTPYLGTKWSVANFSAIERSVDGGRVRQFTADDLLALSRGFDLPLGFFLTPPASEREGVRISTPDTASQGADPMVLMDALLGTEDNFGVWENVLATWGAFAGSRAGRVDGKWGDKGPNVADQLPRARRLLQSRARVLLRRQFGDLDAARGVLTTLLETLGELESQDVEQDAPAKRSGSRPES